MTEPRQIAVVRTRAEAKTMGLKRYFTGESCRNGHVCERSVSSRGCFDCLRVRRMKRYRILSLDKENSFWREKSLTNARYRSRNKEKILPKQRERYHRDKANRLAAIARWQKANPDKVRKIRRRYRQTNSYKMHQRKRYYTGPLNPKGEMQWLRKNQAQLRSVRRLLHNLGAGRLPIAEFPPGHSSLN